MAGNTEYKNNWAKEKLDRISLTVPKGRKAELQEHAQQHSKSLNTFIKQAIDEKLEHDKRTDFIEKCAKECNKTVEEAQEAVDLAQAVKLIDSKIPGFEELYRSGQLPNVIARRTKVSQIGKPDATIYR